MSKNKKHILAVHDEKEILELIKCNLEQNVFDVSTAQTVSSALKKARTLFPDAIILDLMLPGIDGLAVCRVLKSHEDTSNISIIMQRPAAVKKTLLKVLN